MCKKKKKMMLGHFKQNKHHIQKFIIHTWIKIGWKRIFLKNGGKMSKIKENIHQEIEMNCEKKKSHALWNESIKIPIIKTFSVENFKKISERILTKKTFNCENFAKVNKSC